MIVENYLTVSPAYGREYTKASAAMQDWLEGRDFKMESMIGSGSYCSIRDFAAKTKVQVRYSRLTKVVVVETPETERK